MGNSRQTKGTDKNRIIELELQLQELRSKLDEAQEVLRAIHGGEVDAVLVSTPEGERTFTLEGADHPYRVFIENIGEGAVTLTADGTILYCNYRFANIARQPQEQLIGSSFFKHLPAEHHALVNTLLKQSAIKECKGEIELQTIIGSPIPLQLSVSNLRLKDSDLRCMVITDLTDQKRNQDILAQEQLTRSILEQTNEAIIICDENGTIIRANKKAKSYCGNDALLKHFDQAFSLSDACGHPIPSFIPDILNGERVVNVELKLTRSSAAPLYVIGNAIPLYNAGRAVIGSLITFYDITKLKAAEDVLRRDKDLFEQLVNERTGQLLEARIQLEHAKRMSDIGRLSSTMAHEMRNPLAAIRIAAYNIRRKSENPFLDTHLETINKKVLEGDQIINNLLGFTRIKSVSYEPVKIHEILIDCMASVSIKYVNWKVDLQECLHFEKDAIIEADATQLKMLISNLLDNAYQALIDQTGIITVTVCKNGEVTWEITIKDTGIGIDSKEKEKLFEPFYTTKSTGTGLGLAICNEIVNMHNGKIEVISAKGEGSAFIVSLPVRQTAAQPATTSINQLLNEYVKDYV